MEKLHRVLSTFVLAIAIAFGCTASVLALPTSITLTSGTAGLNLGGANINYAGNDSAVEADRPGLFMSHDNNVGSVLTIRSDGTAGVGEAANPLLVTVTASTHLDIQNGLPSGYDIHGGVISITGDNGKNDSGDKRGLGVRAFGIDTDTASANYGKRYVNPSYTSVNGHGFQMEGSKEVSGGTDFTNWQDFVNDNPGTPSNNPPHVDESVTFNFNNSLFNVNGNSIEVILENFKFDYTGRVGLEIGLTGGTILSYGMPGSAGYDALLSSDTSIFTELDNNLGRWSLNFDGLNGLGDSDNVNYFEIRALNDYRIDGSGNLFLDPSQTAEHFLINGFAYDATTTTTTNIPAPGAVLLGSIGIGFVGWLRRRKMI